MPSATALYSVVQFVLNISGIFPMVFPVSTLAGDKLHKLHEPRLGRHVGDLRDAWLLAAPEAS